MKPFKHINAKTVNEATALLQKYKGKARLIAGGTDLLGILKGNILPKYPEAVIDIKTIKGLDYIKENTKGLKIGALTKLTDIANSQLIKTDYGTLHLAAKSVATTEIRNMGTIGGNLCQHTRCYYYRYPHQIGGRLLCWRKGAKCCLAVSGDNRYHAIMGGKKCFAVCPSDIAGALTALNAVIKIKGSGSSRTIPVQDFYTPMGTTLNTGEMVTEIQIPKPPRGAKQTFIKFTLRKPIDFAVVSVASSITLEGAVCKDAIIILGAVAPSPIRATAAEQLIKGKIIDEVIAVKAGEAALAGAKALSKNEYKIEIAKTLIKRAILS